MTRKGLKIVLMERDGLTDEEATKKIKDAEEEFLSRVESGGDVDDFMLEEFGLEPDYIEDLIDGLY